MSWIPDRYHDLRQLLWGRRIDEEIDEEFAFHVEMLVADNIARGMTPSEARASAQLRFGDAARHRRETREEDVLFERDRRRSDHWTSLTRELRYALRGLRRTPGFAVAAVLTLALGIGATTSIYGVLDAVVLRPLPYPESDRLVHMSSRVPGIAEDQRWGLSVAGFHHFAAHAQSLESIGAYTWREVTAGSAADAERVRMAMMTPGMQDVLRMSPHAGRLFTEAEGRPGSSLSLVLGYDYWRARYGGDPAIIGTELQIESRPARIVGVLPPGVHMPSQRIDVWLPLVTDPDAVPENAHWLTSVARLNRGVSVADAVAEIERMTARFPDHFPDAYSPAFMATSRFETVITPLRAFVTRNVSGVLWILLGAVGLVLLIACANVANLFLVRFDARRREVAIRSAMGARRVHLAWHCLAESTLLGMAATAFGLLFALGGMNMLVTIAPAGFPRLHDIGLSVNMVGCAALLGFASAFVFGMLPVVQHSWRVGELHEARHMLAVPRRRVMRNSLVVVQVALALLLLGASALLLQSFRNLRAVDAGFDPAGVLTFELFLPLALYDDPDAVSALYQELKERLDAIPGVVVAGAVDGLPTASGTSCSLIFTEDRPDIGPGHAPCVRVFHALPGYFESLGIRLDGRVPTLEMLRQRSGEVVISPAVAALLWPDEDPIGKGLRGNGQGPPYYRVIGVTAPVRFAGLDQPPPDAVYFPVRSKPGAPLWDIPRFMHWTVRSDGDPLAHTAAVRAAVTAVDARLGVQNVRTMEQVLAQSAGVARTNFVMLLLLIAASVALLLSAIGIYGVISYTVGQRTGEIGVRIALGAGNRQVRVMILRQSLMLVVAGLLIGVVAAQVVFPFLAPLLFEVGPTNLGTTLLAAAVLVGVAAVASFLPARRAAAIEPMHVLRSDGV